MSNSRRQRYGWRDVFLRFLRERPPIQKLFYPACCASRNADHPSNKED